MPDDKNGFMLYLVLFITGLCFIFPLFILWCLLIYDLFAIPGIVEDANRKLLPPQPMTTVITTQPPTAVTQPQPTSVVVAPQPVYAIQDPNAMAYAHQQQVIPVTQATYVPQPVHDPNVSYSHPPPMYGEQQRQPPPPVYIPPHQQY